MKFIQSSRGTRVIFHAPITVRSAGAFCTTITIVEDMSYPGESINYWKAKLDNNFWILRNQRHAVPVSHGGHVRGKSTPREDEFHTY